MTKAEFLVRVRTTVPVDLSDDAWAEVIAAERLRGSELRDTGVIAHIWRIPATATVENVGVWRAADRAELQAAIDSLPARAWMQIEITPLERHPLTLD